MTTSNSTRVKPFLFIAQLLKNIHNYSIEHLQQPTSNFSRDQPLGRQLFIINYL